MVTQFPLDPVSGATITIKLYKNVQNVPSLHQKLVAGKLQCCLMNPALILDPFQIIVAANKALVAENTTTKSIYTEILFNLSISKNISKSLQQFGIQDKCKNILAVVIDQDNSDKVVALSEVQGNEVDLSNLTLFHDLARIKKAYKLGQEEEKCSSLIDSIVSRIVTKDFVSH